MTEPELQVFVTGAARYFEQVSARPPFIDPPYLRLGNEELTLDFTGWIGITGRRRGSVFFSASRAMIHRLFDVLEETDRSTANCCDLVGEVANTISGNARELFGQEFHISVPAVFEGSGGDIMAVNLDRGRPFVIPIVWQGFRAHLVIAFEG